MIYLNFITNIHHIRHPFENKLPELPIKTSDRIKGIAIFIFSTFLSLGIFPSLLLYTAYKKRRDYTPINGSAPNQSANTVQRIFNDKVSSSVTSDPAQSSNFSTSSISIPEIKSEQQSKPADLQPSTIMIQKEVNKSSSDPEIPSHSSNSSTAESSFDASLFGGITKTELLEHLDCLKNADGKSYKDLIENIQTLDAVQIKERIQTVAKKEIQITVNFSHRYKHSTALLNDFANLNKLIINFIDDNPKNTSEAQFLLDEAAALPALTNIQFNKIPGNKLTLDIPAKLARKKIVYNKKDFNLRYHYIPFQQIIDGSEFNMMAVKKNEWSLKDLYNLFKVPVEREEAFRKWFLNVQFAPRRTLALYKNLTELVNSGVIKDDGTVDEDQPVVSDQDIYFFPQIKDYIYAEVITGRPREEFDHREGLKMKVLVPCTRMWINIDYEKIVCNRLKKWWTVEELAKELFVKKEVLQQFLDIYLSRPADKRGYERFQIDHALRVVQGDGDKNQALNELEINRTITTGWLI
jgi:hypothetical protein